MEQYRPPMSVAQIERAGEAWPASEQPEDVDLDISMDIVRDARPWARDQARKTSRDFRNMRHNGGNERKKKN